MNRLQTLSLTLLIVLPVLTLLIALSVNSLGFFVYSLPGAVTPGVAGFLVSYFSKKQAVHQVVQQTEEMVLEAE